MKFVIALVILVGFSSAHAAPDSAKEDLGGQDQKASIYFRPGDVTCVDAHIDDEMYGAHIPGTISFSSAPRNPEQPWTSPISDDAGRFLRVRNFTKILDASETCADYLKEIPVASGFFRIQRKVAGYSTTHNLCGQPQCERREGHLDETVTITLSPKLYISGTAEWRDWISDEASYNPAQSFWSSFNNQFNDVTTKVHVGPGGWFGPNAAGISGLQCVRDNRGQLALEFGANNVLDINEAVFKRYFSSDEECVDAQTKISESLEAAGKQFGFFEVPGTRHLYMVSKNVMADTQCDQTRVEQIETELEGLKFIATNTIPLNSSASRCRR